MALRSLMQLRGLLESLPGGSKNIAPTDMQNNTPPSYELQVILTIGANVIGVPALADGVIIIFDPTSTTVKILMGQVGDVGVTLAKNKWNVISFDTTPPGQIIIDSSANDTAKYTTFIFF